MLTIFPITNEIELMKRKEAAEIINSEQKIVVFFLVWNLKSVFVPVRRQE